MANIGINFVCTLTHQLLNVITPLIVLPYVTRILGGENIGIYNYCDAVVQYVIFICCLGTNLFSQREIAKARNDNERISIFWTTIFVRFFMLILLFGLYLYLCYCSQFKTVFFLMQLAIASAVIDISWFYFGVGNFKIVVLRNLFTKIVSIILVFVFVREQTDLYKFIIIVSGTGLFSNILLWLGVTEQFRKISISSLYFKKYIPQIISLFIPQVLMNVYIQLDKVLVGWLSNEMAEVAFYSLAIKIVRVATIVSTAMSMVMITKISASYNKENLFLSKKYLKRSMNVINSMTIPLSFGVAAVAKDFSILYFGKEYSLVGINMIILAPIVFFSGVSNAIGFQYFISIGEEKKIIQSVSIGIFIDIVLNVILVPVFGSMGAAIATMLTEFVIAVAMVYYVSSYLKFKKLFLGIGSDIVSGIVMYSVIVLIKEYSCTNLFIEIVIGIAIYILMSIFFNTLLIRCLKKYTLFFCHKLM